MSTRSSCFRSRLACARACVRVRARGCVRARTCARSDCSASAMDAIADTRMLTSAEMNACGEQPREAEQQRAPISRALSRRILPPTRSLALSLLSHALSRFQHG